jgi:VanZ family protein
VVQLAVVAVESIQPRGQTLPAAGLPATIGVVVNRDDALLSVKQLCLVPQAESEMSTMRFGLRCLMAVVSLTIPAAAEQTSVKTSAELRAAWEAAKPGDVILLLPGNYEGGLTLSDRHGNEAAAITVRGAIADNPPIIRGGDNGLKFSNVSHLTIENIVIEQATTNGLHIDDGGNLKAPAHHIVLRKIVARDIGQNGNFDGFKLSGLLDFEIYDCTVEKWAGQGMDLVGCRSGKIVRCRFDGKDASPLGLQMKGGSRDIIVEDCDFTGIKERCVQFGGSTGLPFFRPEPQGFEAKDITVRDCRFCRGEAAVTFVSIDGATFERNVIYRPQKYVIRILQEQLATGFVPSRNGKFVENIIVWRNDELRGGVANVGPNTAPETFEFANNYWYREDFPQRSLPRGFPTTEQGSVLGIDPKLMDPERGDLRPLRTREAMRKLASSRPSWVIWVPLIRNSVGLIAAIVTSVWILIHVFRWMLPAGSPAADATFAGRTPSSLAGWFGGLAIMTVVLAVYGSLVPLEYQPKPWDVTYELFLKTPYLRLDVYHLADWVANLLLFVPISYSATMTFAVARRSLFGRLLVAVVVAIPCMALAFAIEFIQLWFPPRTVSQNDILAECLGTAAGCGLAVFTAIPVRSWLTAIMTSVRPIRIFDRLLQAYTLAYVVYAVMPLDLVFTREAFQLKAEAGRLGWLWAGAPKISGHQWLMMTIELAATIPVGLWIGRQRGGASSSKLVECLAMAMLVELAQLFVFTRNCTAAGAVISAIGMAIGVQLARNVNASFDTWWTPAAAAQRSRWVWLGLGAYAVGLLFLLARPLQWEATPLLSQRIQSFWTPPFSALYWGSEFHALTVTVQGMLLFAPVGFALSDLSFARCRGLHSKEWAVGAFFLLAVFASGLELAQAWIPGSTVDVTTTISFLMGGLAGFLLRNAVNVPASGVGDDGECTTVPARYQPAWVAGFLATTTASVILTGLAAGELAAWTDGFASTSAWMADEDSSVPFPGNYGPFTPQLELTQSALRVTRIPLPDFDGANAIWGSSGTDAAGRIWFGVSANQSPGASSRLMWYDPRANRVQVVGSPLSELRRYKSLEWDEAQCKIHSRIVAGPDGMLYFTSMDEQGEAEDGSRLPAFGSHLWRVDPNRPKFEHLASVPEGLIAIAAGGKFLYSLGLFDHVLYQFDPQTKAMNKVRVGSVGGHVSRNFLADHRGHAYVPRLRFQGRPGEPPPAIPLEQTPGIQVTLVEYDTALREVGEWPLPQYLASDKWSAHGITGWCQLRSGALVFVTCAGYLYYIDPGEAEHKACVTPIGWAHPKGPRYIASLFPVDGIRNVVLFASGPEKRYEAITFDLRDQIGRTIPLRLPSDVGAEHALLYGSMTRDRSGAFYLVGTEYNHPLLLRVETAGSSSQRR